MLPSKTDQKKIRKRERLLASALELFLEKDPDRTAVGDITRRAGVAKGTFYLYFRDRNEILGHIVAQAAASLLCESVEAAAARGPTAIEEELIYTAEELIDRTARSPRLVAMLHRNLPWKLLAQELQKRGGRPASLLTRLSQSRGEAEAKTLLFMAVELLSSVAYSSVVHGEPAPMEAMRPPLLAALRRILAP